MGSGLEIFGFAFAFFSIEKVEFSLALFIRDAEVSSLGFVSGRLGLGDTMTVSALLTTGGGGVSGLVTALALGFGFGFGLDSGSLFFEPIFSPSISNSC